MSDITSVPRIGLSTFCEMLEIALLEPKIKARLPSANAKIKHAHVCMTRQGVINFAEHNGVSNRAQVISAFPRALGDTLLCHPVSDCMVVSLGTLLPLHQYIMELDVSSLADSTQRFKRILLPMAEVGNFGVTIGGYMLPVVNTVSRMLNAKRAHWALLEIQYDTEDFGNESGCGSKLKVIVHDSKPAIVSSGLYFTGGAYPVINYLREQFKSVEMRNKLGALLGVHSDKLQSPDISVNAYGTQSLSNDTECGHHMLVTTLALLQDRTYTDVLVDLGGSLGVFYSRCERAMCLGFTPTPDVQDVDFAGFEMIENDPERPRPR